LQAATNPAYPSVRVTINDSDVYRSQSLSRIYGEATIYRKARAQHWKEIANGLPKAKGSMMAVVTAAESGSFTC